MRSIEVLLLPFGFLPLILRLSQGGFRGGFHTTFGKMSIFMTNLAFKRNLFIVYFLQIGLVIQFKLDYLRVAFFQINLHTYLSVGLKTIFWFHLVNILSERVTNGLEDFLIPTVKRK
jgi:hypothetical protein